MADDTLEAALKQLLQERAELDSVIAALQRRLGKGSSVTPSVAVGQTPTTPSAEVVTFPGEFHQHSMPQAAEKILKRAGRPLRTSELIDALGKAKFEIRGKAPHSQVYTALARGKAFIKVQPNTWALADWYPESAAKAETPRPRKRRSANKRRGGKVVGHPAAAEQDVELKKVAG